MFLRSYFISFGMWRGRQGASLCGVNMEQVFDMQPATLLLKFLTIPSQ